MIKHQSVNARPCDAVTHKVLQADYGEVLRYGCVELGALQRRLQLQLELQHK